MTLVKQGFTGQTEKEEGMIKKDNKFIKKRRWKQ
jgi:hypothetical protein